MYNNCVKAFAFTVGCGSMEKDMRMALLLDLYQNGLTQRQADAMDLYFNQDLSLAEIGQHLRISRQGVRDLIQRGQGKLLELDREFGLMQRFLEQGRQLRQARRLLLAIQQDCGPAHQADFERIVAILDRWIEPDGSE